LPEFGETRVIVSFRGLGIEAVCLDIAGLQLAWERPRTTHWPEAMAHTDLCRKTGFAS
jgi:hypothetical protein